MFVHTARLSLLILRNTTLTASSSGDNLDLFIFLGEPKDILSGYRHHRPVGTTALVVWFLDESPYNSEEQVCRVAAQLRAQSSDRRDSPRYRLVRN
jgi:hypothetical protein